MRKLIVGFISCLLFTLAAVASGCGADAASPVDGTLPMEPRSSGPTANRFGHHLALAASAYAAPEAETVYVAETCYHPSDCRADWSGKCEAYCKRHGGFSHMTDCGWLNPLSKRCCCNKP
jgi:hypothetical protein